MFNSLNQYFFQRVLWVIFLITSLQFACESNALNQPETEGLDRLEGPEMSPDPIEEPSEDQGVTAATLDRGAPPVVDPPMVEDMAIEAVEDQEMTRSFDGDIPEGPRCDPRLRAASCEAGYACLPVPGGGTHEGRCVQGDDCSLIGESGCPEATPYCHLSGRSTQCTSPGILQEGEICLDEFNRVLPCAEGLVCNFSVCTPPCDPAQPDMQCGEYRRCIDLSDSLGTPQGFCAPRGVCDLFTQDGCDADEACQFAFQADTQELIYFCVQRGMRGEGEECAIGQGGQTDCAPGFTCIGPGGTSPTCRRLCDTGSYVAPCPEYQSCREILGQSAQSIVRGVGLCILNP